MKFLHSRLSTFFQKVLPVFCAISFLLLLSSCSEDEQDIVSEPVEEKEWLDCADKTMPKPRDVVSVIYVEVNSYDMRNVMAYSHPDGEPFFNIANIFAANINYDVNQDKAVLFFNPNVERVLENKQMYVEPLQEKGIKVLLSVLGNHQGVGIANFETAEKAADFAKQVADAVDKYDLDGVDLDDEFSKYGTNGQPEVNSESLLWLLEALRNLMPDKLISYYRIGPSSEFLNVNGKEAGNYIDYSYQPYYGRYNAGITVSGLCNARISASAINVRENPLFQAIDFARRTKADQFGAYMMYNLDGIDRADYFSQISTILYEQEVMLTEKLY
ncbi:MAG: endo-beta-N-acetylglucosaminidase H [Bacteroidota bacterium]